MKEAPLPRSRQRLAEETRTSVWRTKLPWAGMALTGALLLTSLGCGNTRIPIDDKVAIGLCHVLLRGFGVLPPGPVADEYDFDRLYSCAGALLRTTAEPDLDMASGLLATRKAEQTGETLLAAFGAEGRVRAAAFPRTRIDVPYGNLEASGTDTVHVVVTASFLNGNTFEGAKSLFKSMEVTLRNDVDGAVGSDSTKLRKQDLGGSVVFENVQTRRGLQAVIDFSGGAVRDATILLDVQAVLPTGTAEAAGGAWGEANAPAGRPSQVGAPKVSVPAQALKVSGPANILMAFYRAQGSVKATKFPKMVLDLVPNKSGKLAVDAGILLMNDRNYKTPKAKQRPTSISATLQSVKKNGKAKRIGAAKDKIGNDGSADVQFRKVEVPSKGHLRVVIKFTGKSLEDTLVLAYGSAG